MAKTRWFNAIKEPPVNGGPSAKYEWRANATSRSVLVTALMIVINTSANEQWRGLTRDEYLRRGGK